MENLDNQLPHCLSEIIPPHIPVQLFSYKPGTFLFRENHDVKGIYYICSGTVQLFRINKNGVLQKLATVGADEWMGVAGALFNKKHMNCAKAVTDVEVCFISLEDFERMLPENPALGKKLLQNLNHRLNKIDHMHTV